MHWQYQFFLKEDEEDIELDWLDDDAFTTLKEATLGKEKDFMLRYGEWSLDLSSYQDVPTQDILPDDPSNDARISVMFGESKDLEEGEDEANEGRDVLIVAKSM